MKLAIVTACPNGMVTSVLCARLLDAAAQRQGWSTSVEVVDAAHPERQLSAATIEAAEWVLLVTSAPVDMSRFVGKKVFQSTPAHALQDVEAVLRRGAEEAQTSIAISGTQACRLADAYGRRIRRRLAFAARCCAAKSGRR